MNAHGFTYSNFHDYEVSPVALSITSVLPGSEVPLKYHSFFDHVLVLSLLAR